MKQYYSNQCSWTNIISIYVSPYEIQKFPGEPYEIRFGVALHGRYHERPGCCSPRDFLATSWGSLCRGCGGTHKEKWGAFPQRLHQVAGKKRVPLYVFQMISSPQKCLKVFQLFGKKRVSVHVFPNDFKWFQGLGVISSESLSSPKSSFLRIRNSFSFRNIWEKLSSRSLDAMTMTRWFCSLDKVDDLDAIKWAMKKSFVGCLI